MKRRRQEFCPLLQRYLRLIPDERGRIEKSDSQTLLRRIEMEMILGKEEVLKLYHDFLEFFGYSREEIEKRIVDSVPYSC